MMQSLTSTARHCSSSSTGCSHTQVELPSLAKYHPHALVIRVFRVRGVSEESRSFCRTHRAYPPGLGAILAEAKDFRQLEDFNRQ